MSTAPILVLAVGNPSRGDDAFGPLLAEQLADWLQLQGDADDAMRRQIELITDLQLMVEHVFDLQGRARVLFIDAAAQGGGGPTVSAVKALRTPPVHQSHACTPAQLLSRFAQLLSEPLPNADLLSLSGCSFELSDPLSPPVQAAMPEAWQCLMAWLREASNSACASSVRHHKAV